ncbi:hypothetical protein EV191_102494 [Tamaricihabitans halophyticus]|uniref:J domain-containing protein n=1 Tax=Tamaricihabitans halophyticus TaxID=1262583 RepID=A0A4R2QYF3_9PSEU|nr:hypothetical protein EV191_102494 [Tamaricihabitans halophyticus]
MRWGRAVTEEERRAAFLAFIRAHHPDTGGDPEVFKAGLARFERMAEESARSTQQAEHTDPYDAPIEIVRRPRGLRLPLFYLRRWRERRNRAPRVE